MSGNWTGPSSHVLHNPPSQHVRTGIQKVNVMYVKAYSTATLKIQTITEADDAATGNALDKLALTRRLTTVGHTPPQTVGQRILPAVTISACLS